MVHFINFRGKSSLVEEVYYDDLRMELTVKLTYDTAYVYEDVRIRYFEMFSEVDSIGKYFLTIIKNKFKTKIMADRKTVNSSSKEKRFIKMSLDVSKINKSLLIEGEKGTYMNVTLHMLPDGELDKFGNLGMITQDVPKKIVDAEKDLEKKDKTQGVILGNGCEFARANSFEGSPQSSDGDLASKEAIDDLPF